MNTVDLSYGIPVIEADVTACKADRAKPKLSLA
jgi:hypothetical protein